MNYVQAHLDSRLVGTRCFVCEPYEDEVRTGVIAGVQNDGRSQHVSYLPDGETQRYYTAPQLVFLSPPILVKIVDIYGECSVWEESEMSYR